MDSAREDPGVRLMLAWQAGDESAFDRLVERYSGQVWALVTRFMGVSSKREDLVQDAFLRVVRARDRYQPTARFSTWLYRIVFNLCVNETEKVSERRKVSLEAERTSDGSRWLQIEDEGIASPDERLERADVVLAVRRAIAELPEKQRMALILAKYDELPYVEIAAVLDSSEKAIKSMIHRARENLRETLAPFLERDEA